MPLRILIAIDGSDASRDALTFARDVAPADNVVRVVSVVPAKASILPRADATTPVLEFLHDDLVQDAKGAFSAAMQIFAHSGIQPETETIELSARDADIGHAIVTAAAAWNAGLIVVGARQHRQWLGWLEGSVSSSLTGLCSCPLLIVPQAGFTGKNRPAIRILFAVDSAENAQHCAMYGVRFAMADSHLRAVYVAAPPPVWPGGDDGTNFDNGAKGLGAAKRILERVSDNVTTATVGAAETSDDIARALVQEAAVWDADLLVMGMHSSRGMKRFLVGSVANRVAHLTRTPLLLVDVSGA
jgi:nucleotide-binding universal stress UspA family protein